MTKQLLSGIDTLVYSMDILWSNNSFFEYLSELKNTAKEKKTEFHGVLKGKTKDDDWPFLIKPFGSEGYEWIIYGHEYNIKIGNWQKPTTKPGVIIYIRSETLWSNGVIESIERINDLIKNNGGKILKMNTSRVDLCVDLLIDSDVIDLYLRNHITKKARKWYLLLGASNDVQTIQVGIKSKLQCTIYDKALEIKERKKKDWFYDLWKLEEVPCGKSIFRVEFKLRREPLKEMGLGDLKHFISNCDQVWAYCTQKWLKFEIDKSVQHRDRKIMEWWEVTQSFFLGIQKPFPAIRKKAIKGDIEQLKSMIVGVASSMTALTLDKYQFDYDETVDFKGCIGAVLEAYEKDSNDDFKTIVTKKRVKYSRAREKERAKYVSDMH